MASKKAYFEPVDPKVNFPELEEKVLKKWEKDNTFEKSVNKNRGKKAFVFYEGPPTANGKPGIHHVESRSFKDIIPRYKTMQGYYVPRKAGWDCHGLPVELEVEKKLGISGKPEIEKYGIEEFCSLCRESVFEYVEEWEKVTKRIGFWLDTQNAYETMTNDFIESEWYILKQIWDKGWMYEDYKVVPYCARCGTSLSSHELALGYKDDVEDPSVFIKFKVKGKDNTYLLAWTTTPWTLPGNLALAVDSKEKYVEVDTKEGKLILAAKRQKALAISGKINKSYKGKELEGWEYEPLYSFVSYDQKAHYVVSADFVSMDDGTGIVHTAVMYGEDDFNLGKKYGLPQKHLVNERGEFIEEVTPWAGMFVKKTDKAIIADLAKRKLLFRSETIKHTYPFCWRCGTPLLYYALTSWYLKTTAVKDQLIKNNKSVNWIPEHIRNGRMGEWLENNRDWALSRSRYWGTPLPVWKCSDCDCVAVIGSVEELAKRSGKDLKTLDLHRPFIDEITFGCDCTDCNGKMTRVNFVLDCWFDSGAMPYAQWHYPFENKEKFSENFPADYISEAIDQTRGWFYTLQAVSALLEKGTAYKNVICLGHVLDGDGNKMSKSKGNIVNPWDVLDEVGADATRWYFYSAISAGQSFRFSSDLVKDVIKRFMLTLWNSYNFFVTYANLDGWKPGKSKAKISSLDEWVLVRLDQTVNSVTKNLDDYNLYDATHVIEDFVSKDLSQWYIRRSRDRAGAFAKSTEDRHAFLQTTHTVLTTIVKLIAPFMPFVSDVLFENLAKSGSVHLADWPESQEISTRSKKLLSDMEVVREVVEKIHADRKDKQVAVRVPLAKATVTHSAAKIAGELLELIKDETNVKEVVWKKGKTLKVVLDTKLTPALEEESKTRELIRSIQVERRKIGTALSDYVAVSNPWLPESAQLIEQIKKRALVKSLSKGNFSVVRSS